jgi:hypothetical protein
MKPGSHVRIIPELEGSEDHKILWDDPPTFTSIYTKKHVGRFHYSDTGIVLEQKHILDGPLHFQITWIKVLCSSGNIGWMKRCDLELVG